jgi:tRNA(fMet)-specific endonuclease VapC
MILDTSVLIASERGELHLERLLLSLGTEQVRIAAITVSELLHGSHRARSAAVRARRSAFADAVIDLVPALPFGLAEARRHAELWAHLAAGGKVIGAHDLLIAATALAHGHSLATLNRGEFARVPGLRLADLGKFVA